MSSGQINETYSAFRTQENDEILIGAYIRGDIKAGENIVYLYWQRVFRFACRLSGNPEDAADITQETFLRAFSNLHKVTFRKKQPLKAWLFRIATNLFLDKVKKDEMTARKIQEFRPARDREREGRGMGGRDLDRQEMIEEIWHLVQTMSLDRQIIFTLRIREELDYAAIGQIVGKDENTIRWHMFSIRDELVKKLDARFKGLEF